MHRKLALVLVLLALGLAGCTGPFASAPEEEGTIRIVIGPPENETATIEPKVIPDEATKVRIRVWHPDTGFNAVATVTIGAEDEVNIPVPADEGYTVDAVSYYVQENRPLALTGGRANGVDVATDAVTNVRISLREWHSDVFGDNNVEPESMFGVEIVPTDGGGLLALQTFKGATLHTSATAFDEPDDPLPLFPGTQGILFDDRIAFTAMAPDVNELTVLFVAALVEFSQNWMDATLADRDEHSLFIEFPNRHTGEDLHQVTIDPAAGGLVVEISDL